MHYLCNHVRIRFCQKDTTNENSSACNNISFLTKLQLSNCYYVNKYGSQILKIKTTLKNYYLLAFKYKSITSMRPMSSGKLSSTIGGCC